MCKCRRTRSVGRPFYWEDSDDAPRSLVPVVHEDTFWFVWAAFRPQTRIWKQ